MTSSTRLLGPLFLDGWLEYNHRRWGVRPVRRTFHADGDQLPALDAVYYTNRRGRITHLPGNPYLPVAFTSTKTDARPRLYRQWLSVADLYAEEMKHVGLAGAVALSPETSDVRSWQWRRFQTGVRYTFYIDFPYAVTQADNTVRKNQKKAVGAGYTVTREPDLRAAHTILLATEARQGFSHRLSFADLKLLHELLGDDHLRVYICRTSTGIPVSARIVLHRSGARAIDWVAGTDTEHLRAGVTQQLIAFALDDLQAAGATGFDFAGANIRNIAAAKSDWGGSLVSYPTLEAYNLRFVVKTAREMARALHRPAAGAD